MPHHDDEPSFDWADLPATPDDQHRHLVECAVAVNGSGELHDLVAGVIAKRICGHNPPVASTKLPQFEGWSHRHPPDPHLGFIGS